MGCSASTEAGVRRGNVASSSSPGPTAPHPSDVEESNKPAPLLSTATSVKTDFNTSTTQASFFYGFKGGGRSSGSATGSDTQLASRSDAGFGSDLGSSSSRTSSGRRFGSASGGSSGEALLEKEEESDFEDDFEDADDDASPRGRWLRQEGARGRRDGDTGKKSEADDGVVVAKLEEIGTTLGGQTDDPLSGTAKEDRAIKAAEATARYEPWGRRAALKPGFCLCQVSRQGSFAMSCVWSCYYVRLKARASFCHVRGWLLFSLSFRSPSSSVNDAIRGARKSRCAFVWGS